MNKQPEALRLADWLYTLDVLPLDCIQNCVSAADELRRLNALNAELLEALKEIVDASDADEWNGVSTMKARAAIAKAEGKQ